jgi:hypothetical protein
VEGAPRFERGEDVILFLERSVDEPTVFQVSGFAAGKIRIEPSKFGGLRASRDLSGISQYRLGTIDRTPRLEIRPLEDLGPVEALLHRLRAAVRQEKK